MPIPRGFRSTQALCCKILVAVCLLGIILSHDTSLDSSQSVFVSTRQARQLSIWQEPTISAMRDLALSGAEHPFLASLRRQRSERMQLFNRFGPVSTVNKTYVPLSGDKRDFVSFVPYAWPCNDLPPRCIDYAGKKHNLSQIQCHPDGKPWLICDGQFNRKAMKNLDIDHFQTMVDTAVVMALSCRIFDEQESCNIFLTQLRVWFLDAATAMHPRLLFSQIIPGSLDKARVNGSYDSVIDFYSLPYLMESITLMQHEVPASQLAKLELWMAEFLDFIRTEKIRTLHEAHVSNHGAWYDVVVMCIAHWLSRGDIVREVAEKAKRFRIMRYINSEGDMPKETSRQASTYYFGYTLDAMSVIAHYASYANVDLWTYIADNGASLAKAFTFGLQHLLSTAGSSWPYPNHGHSLQLEYFLRPLRLAAMAYDDISYIQAIEELPIRKPLEELSLLISPMWHLRKADFAVAFVFHRSESGAVLNDISKEGVCALAANIASLRQLMRNTFPIDALPDIILVTDKSEASFFTSKERHLLQNDLGVKIVHSSAMERYDRASPNITCTGSQELSLFFKINMLKIEVACLPYRGVLYLDIDNFVTYLRPSFWELLQQRTCRGWSGATSPFAGSEFLMVPSRSSCKRLRGAVDRGFSPRSGWSNSGLMPIWKSCRCPLERMAPFCISIGLPFDKNGSYPRFCSSKTGLMEWRFHASCADQGLLYWECAVATATGAIYKSQNATFEGLYTSIHYWGAAKPWNSQLTNADKGVAFRNAYDLATQSFDSFVALCADAFWTRTRPSTALESVLRQT